MRGTIASASFLIKATCPCLEPQRGEIFIVMESRIPELHRSDMEIHISPRWGYSSFEVIGCNDVASPELKNGSSAAARTLRFDSMAVSLGPQAKAACPPIGP